MLYNLDLVRGFNSGSGNRALLDIFELFAGRTDITEGGLHKKNIFWYNT